MSECKKRSASKAAKELIRDAVHQEMRENGRIKRAHRNKKKKTTKNVSRIIGGNGKHGFGKGNRLRDGKQVGKTTFVPSSLKPTPKKIKTVFPGLGRRIDGHDSPLHVEKEDYGQLEKMTDRFSCAILFDIMKKGKKSKIDDYFKEHLMGAVESVRGISRATATNAGEFKIIKLKGGVYWQVAMFWAKRMITWAMQMTIMILPTGQERVVNRHLLDITSRVQRYGMRR
jgi:hypothetical protein